MEKQINIGIIGLDSSHTLEYVRRMQDVNFDSAQRTTNLRATKCMSLVTPFQNAEGIAARSQLLSELGVSVSESFEQTIQDVDAIMIELNDPATHLEYLERCLPSNLPIFLDKPMADTLTNANSIARLIKQKSTKFFTASPLRFAREVQDAARQMPQAESCFLWGPIGEAAAGSNLVWYGVHLFEMLNKLMGAGAKGVRSIADDNGVVCMVSYHDNRRGVLEFTTGAFRFGGVLRQRKEQDLSFAVNAPNAEFYGETLKAIEGFFLGAAPPVELSDSLEIMSLIEAADASLRNGGEYIEISKEM